MSRVSTVVACLSVASFAGAGYLACSVEPLRLAARAPAPAVASAAILSPEAGPPRVHIQILAINDFHGHLEPPTGSNGMVLAAPSDPLASLPGARATDAGFSVVPAGGAAYLAAHIARLRAENPATIVVSAGDLTGATPLMSNLLDDAPTVAAMNCVGLDVEAVGNHDFDRGLQGLKQLQKSGCVLGDCDAGTFAGASFEYLAANVIDDSTGRTIFAPYTIRELAGVRVAFIGETLAQTASVARAGAVNGLTFLDEATTANALVPELEKQGVSAIVLVIHQGGMQALGGTYDGCKGFSGDLLPILDRLSPAIDVVISGHTHQAYDCVVGGRLVTSAASYGRLITKIDLTIDPEARRVVASRARNVPVTHDVTPDPKVTEVVQACEANAHTITGRIVGYVKNTLTGNARVARIPSCETPLGDVVADAMRMATGAEIAFMNPGGMRADLGTVRPDFAVTYGDAFEVQPFGNALVTMTLRGAQLAALLAQQFGSRQEPRILQVSRGFTYRYRYDRATEKGSCRTCAWMAGRSSRRGPIA
jgi:5'-nucleotidase